MGEVAGTDVVSACFAAGFQGDALLNIVAIGHRESGWNDTIQGDINLMDATWGPSVGVFQIRTLNADTGTGSDRDLQALVPGATPGAQNSGHGNLARQAKAAWSISGHGTDFSAWSTWKGLPQADKDAAQQALHQLGADGTVGSGGGGGILGGVTGDLAGAIDKGLGAVLGYDGTFSEWAGMVILRGCEVIGGGLLIAAGVIVTLDVVFSGRAREAAGGAARGSGIVARSVRQGVSLAKQAAVVVAA